MSSPFASRLGTNYCAQDKEIVEIKALLVEPCQKLKRLNDEINVMRKALDKLIEERDILSTYVDTHQALISPVRRLHLDILEAIFMACLPTHRNCVMSAQEAPVILGRICSSWRTISLKTPRLWSRLHIVEPNYPYDSPLGVYQSKVEQRLEVADAWLRRSKTCPLSISLESSFDYMSPEPMSTSNAQPFLDILIPFASRWQNISLAISLSGVQTLLRLGENEVPLLKSLMINERRHNQHDIPQWTLPQACILHAPGLTEFSLMGRNAHSPDLPLRWSHLTALTLMGSGWGTSGGTVNPQTCQVVLDILSRCSELRACTLLVHAPLDVHLQDFVLECPFLHTFDLFCDDIPLQVADRLLSRLSLPELRDFKLRGIKLEDPQSAFSADSVLSFLTTLTRLESISIDSAIFSKPILINSLHALPPTVLHLTITNPTWRPPGHEDAIFDDEVLEALATFPDRSSHIPALQEVVIHYCPNLSDEALLRFIMSRPTLKLVDIKFDRERKVDILPSLQPFTEAGLKTSITYSSPPSIPQFSPWQGLPDAPLALWGSP
ncbi:hypothetical protein DFH08DRAFT_934032 [Mycena albidolilacea]|uniref:F-box domain-containing protein n=1 Tax=Mycena albidolilacea TaxID=1033008 RepID=A0AAD7AD88_9AGAR|nr:hypothetical protein DFH08DRAFT_934032 [Mycena albidolilacea]